MSDGSLGRGRTRGQRGFPLAKGRVSPASALRPFPLPNTPPTLHHWAAAGKSETQTLHLSFPMWCCALWWPRLPCCHAVMQKESPHQMQPLDLGLPSLQNCEETEARY
nr:uncharacterized protein LOC130541713 [Pan paniscus]